jgi:hypothetical protein
VISINGRNSKFLAWRLIAIPFWQWDDKDIELQADVDRFVEDGSLDDNVESFLSHDDTDHRDPVGRMDVSKGGVNTNILSIILFFAITFAFSLVYIHVKFSSLKLSLLMADYNVLSVVVLYCYTFVHNFNLPS